MRENQKERTKKLKRVTKESSSGLKKLIITKVLYHLDEPLYASKQSIKQQKSLEPRARNYIWVLLNIKVVYRLYVFYFTQKYINYLYRKMTVLEHHETSQQHQNRGRAANWLNRTLPESKDGTSRSAKKLFWSFLTIQTKDQHELFKPWLRCRASFSLHACNYRSLAGKREEKMSWPHHSLNSIKDVLYLTYNSA